MKRALLPLLVGLVAGSASGQVRLTETWSNVFAETRQVLHAAPPAVPATWSFSVGGALVARGDLAANGEIALDFPPVKPGVVLDGVLRLEAGGRQRTHPLWIFPADPWSETRATLKEAGLQLFDPAGQTAGVLEKAEVPFTRMRNPEAIGALRAGLLLVGEGLSLREQRGLPALLEQAAAAGARVICLAPREGYLGMPGADAEPRPVVSLAGPERVTALDKRLDTLAWPDGPAIATTWSPDASRRRVEGEWRADPRGWPWIEARWPNGGRLTYCGLGLIRSWDKTPSARYILSHLVRTHLGPPGSGSETP